MYDRGFIDSPVYGSYIFKVKGSIDSPVHGSLDTRLYRLNCRPVARGVQGVRTNPSI